MGRCIVLEKRFLGNRGIGRIGPRSDTEKGITFGRHREWHWWYSIEYVFLPQHTFCPCSELKANVEKTYKNSIFHSLTKLIIILCSDTVIHKLTCMYHDGSIKDVLISLQMCLETEKRTQFTSRTKFHIMGLVDY